MKIKRKYLFLINKIRMRKDKQVNTTVSKTLWTNLNQKKMKVKVEEL